ncbi:MAG: hypothetical protein ACYCYO_01790 [Bacilli bacterium]
MLTKREWVHVFVGILSGVLVGVLLVQLIIVLQHTSAPPSTLALAAGQHEGDTMFVGVRGGSLWFEKEADGFIASYLPAFPVPDHPGTRIALNGAVYAVVSVDASTDTVRLKQTNGR